jgi:hypothetical protein
MTGIMMSSISNSAAPRSRGGAASGNLYAFTTFTFTNANTSGNAGPNLSTFLANYNTVTYPWLSNASYFTASNGIQTWTVPATGTYRIVAKGAQGAPYSATAGGVGAVIQGDFSLTQGETIRILVGQTARPPAARAGRNGSGGGGTFVVKSNVSTPSTADILVIAGGGGGCGTAFLPNANASITANGRQSTGGSFIGAGGTGGNGGGQSTGATANGAGGGFLGNGAANGSTEYGGRAYRFGGNGGVINATYAPEGGGFGGGGAPGNGDNNRMGGGGGYSGGGASDAVGNTATSTLAGGGGGSYNNGTNQVNATDSSGNFGNGSVVVTFIG